MRHVNTICLCGSVKYLDEFKLANIELTTRGMSVITISMALDQTQQRERANVKEILDLVHFNKILRSDAVVVVGSGYIGFSTAREILWAQMQGKLLYWLHHRNLAGEFLWSSLLTDISEGEDDSVALIKKAMQVLKAQA